MIKLKWEPVETGSVGCAGRCPVPGGWILQFVESNQPVTYMFIPDLGHTWGRLEEKRKNLETAYREIDAIDGGDRLSSVTMTSPAKVEELGKAIEEQERAEIEEKREFVVTSEGTVGGQACPTCNGLGSTGELFESERCIACNGTGIDRG